MLKKKELDTLRGGKRIEMWCWRWEKNKNVSVKIQGGVDGGGVAGEGKITETCVMVVVVMEEGGKEQWQCGCAWWWG